MASKADILAQLRQSVAAIERGDAAGDAPRPECAPKATGKSARGQRPMAGAARAGAEAADFLGALAADEAAARQAVGAPVQSRGAARAACSEVERARGPISGPRADAGPGPYPCSGRAEGEQAARESEKTAEAAFRKIVRWVAVRERSTAYLRDRLVQDDFPAEAIDEALERALRVRAVDDRRYCDALVRTRLAAGKGLRGVEAEIAELGIDPCSLDAWQEHDARGADAEVERALGVLRRRPPRAKQAREAAFRKLVGQGYATDVAASAARRWYEESLCRE